VLPVLLEYTPVRKHNRVKTPPFSLIVIMIGPGSTKLRRVEFWLAPWLVTYRDLFTDTPTIIDKEIKYPSQLAILKSK